MSAKTPRHFAANWAAAFTGVLGSDAACGLGLLRALAPWVKEIPGELAGTGAARRLEAAVSGAAQKAGVSETAAFKTVLRFVSLLTARGLVRRLDDVIAAVAARLDAAAGIVTADAESAAEIDAALESRLIEAVKKRMAAKEVRLRKKIVPALIGGYRLRIGDEVIDASVKRELRDLAEKLAGSM